MLHYSIRYQIINFIKILFYIVYLEMKQTFINHMYLFK
jgi:hypothetical protein